MGVTCDNFGTTTNGQNVKRFTLKNNNGLVAQVITLGGAVTTLQVPDKNGKVADIVTGYDTVAEYENNAPYFGVLVGRFANRIHKGTFTLDGQTYKLPINNGPNCLHGGPNGFHLKVWDSTVEEDQVKLSCVSSDGEEGFPGEVKCTVTYELNDENELVIDYSAASTKPTPINLTNHCYFNLAGHKADNIYDHIVSIPAEKFTPKNDDNCPTGDIASVNGTEFDLRTPTLLGSSIPRIEGEKPGFDHNFCLEKCGEKKLAARVEHESSGRVMETLTTLPGVQLYTANFLDGVAGKDGARYGQHHSLCLETQHYPDAVNHTNFPDCVLRPGQPFRHATWYKFSVKK